MRGQYSNTQGIVSYVDQHCPARCAGKPDFLRVLGGASLKVLRRCQDAAHSPAVVHAQRQAVCCLRCLRLPCRTRTDAETKREALLRELHELESKLKPMRCASPLLWRWL